MTEPLYIEDIRKEFPILSREVNGKSLVYLDNTATSQTPQSVVKAMTDMYENHKANVHRGVHTLSQEATDMMEAARERVRGYINAESTDEVIFTRGTTEGINLVAQSYGASLSNSDEIILTVMEHHSNIVPWQLLQRNKRISLKVVPINSNGELRQDMYESLFSENTRMVALTHVSNVLGTINPVKKMIETAHRKDVPVLVDGAQAAPHMKIDVRDLDADFYTFSAHKMYGPCGVGILYGKKKLLQTMPPYQGGGEMIQHVSFEKTTFADLPFKFEAGTPDFVGIAALTKAIDFIEKYGIERIAAHENRLLEMATEGLLEIPGMRIFGNAKEKSAVLSFLAGNIHHYDMGLLLDKLGIAVRTGHHCAQPLMNALGVEGTVRASFAIYNTEEDVMRFIEGVKRVSSMF
ncbi:MAG: cysteine desulfurase [Muribaculaceae bacterium]|nr:cysteine desulfurase [Muribaculaceae bacterium]